LTQSSNRLTADDRFEIMDLYSRYAWSMDSGSLEDFANTVTEDARLIYIGKDFVGRDEVRKWEEGFLKDPGFPGTQHFYCNFIMTGTNTEANVRAYVARLYRMPRTSLCQMLWLGYYTDTCVKRNAAWYIHVKAPHPAESMRDKDFSQGPHPIWPPSLYHQGNPRKE
jgi:hypothetical protein